MSEQEIDAFDKDLADALQGYEWSEAERICENLIHLINDDPAAIPLPRIKRIIHRLRRKRMFHLISGISDALLSSKGHDAQIRRQYAQSLIDRDILSAAELVLKEIFEDPKSSKGEKLEAIGLTGRVYKQRFVNASQSDTETKRTFLERAINEYLSGYRLIESSYWHSINVVALLMRGEREGISFEEMPDSKILAQRIFELLSSKEAESIEEPKAWELATMLETQIALGQYDAAAATASAYGLSSDADAFEFNSTLRQLTEIWQLADDEPPGEKILPILHAALLDREGGSVRIESKNIPNEIINLEGVFGDNAPKSITWYKTGLEKSSSIARIETPDGRGIGTGALFDRSDFFPGSEGRLLMTNAHVVSKHPADSGLMADEVRANFQGAGETFEVEEIVWSSPQRSLDTSLLSIKGSPSVESLKIAEKTPTMASPAPRVYVIGHPSGRDLEISLNDNRMVGSNETFVHYRTPTEPGSSGSPVFDQYGWEVVALHHGGSDTLPRIDGEQGTYQANEGIAIHAIQSAIRESGTDQ